MENLPSLTQQIEEILSSYPTNSPQEISVYHLHADIKGHMLAWLKAQSVYPQFYFHRRDSSETLAALGKVRSFSDLFSANQFVQQQDLTLVGGLRFDGQAQCYLPRLLLRRQADTLSLSLFMDNSCPPEQEKAAVRALLPALETQTPLQAVSTVGLNQLNQAASQTQWCAAVERALASFKPEGLNKVVLANATEYHSDSPLNPYDLLAKSEQINQHCYHFLWAENAASAFLGSSPERLYQRRQQQLDTEALAGTAFVGSDPEQNRKQADWLLNDRKNKYENWLVMEGICEHLKDYAQHIDVSPLQIKALRQVQHLYRHISITLKAGIGDDRCLRAIHPTAAVSGLPQQAAMTFIQNNENFDRTWYAGALGFMSRNEAEFCVAIRSAELSCHKIRVFAGAGIVEGSVPLLEWQEIERKAQGILSLLQ